MDGDRQRVCAVGDGPWTAPDHETPSARAHREHQAKIACSRCQHEIECLAEALQQRDRNPIHVRGGLTGPERGEIIDALDEATARA